MRDDLVQIIAHRRGREAAQAIIAAELKNDKSGREHVDSLSNSGCAALSGVTANAGVNHSMFVPLFLQPGLQQSGPGLVNVNTKTGTEAVTKDQDSRRYGRVRLDAQQQQKQGNESTHG